jgi:hypothetical protein
MDYHEIGETLWQFIRDYNITISKYRQVEHNPYMTDMPMRHYDITLQIDYEGHKKQRTFLFSMGMGLKRKPRASDLFECLILDAIGVEYSESFKDWAHQYGYDPETKEAKKIYMAVKKQTARVKELLGEELFKKAMNEIY